VGCLNKTFVIAALRPDEPLADLTCSTPGVFFADSLHLRRSSLRLRTVQACMGLSLVDYFGGCVRWFGV
jgi:hypothetical protein